MRPSLQPRARESRTSVPTIAAQDEDYWSVIQRAYSVNPNLINLNNGGVSPVAHRGAAGSGALQPAFERGPVLLHVAHSRPGPRAAARKAGATGRRTKPDEIAINRNSTEALNTIIYGLDLKAATRSSGPSRTIPT